MKQKIVALLLMVLLAGIYAGCSSRISQLTGKWSGTAEKDGESMVVTAEFFSDNTLNMNMIPLPAKWTILNDGRIKVDFANGLPTILGTLNNHSLILDFSVIGLNEISLKKL